MFVASVVGASPGEVQAALGRLAGCSLPHALQLPHVAALQPQGWLAGRMWAVPDAAAGTLWVGMAAGGDGAHAEPLSLDGSKEKEAAAARALLLAFLTSHAVLWLAPAHALSRDAAGLLRTLRTLQQLKTTLLPCLPPLLGVPAQQASAAQPGLCIPQLLLLAPPGAAAGGQPPRFEEQQHWAAAADRQLRSLLKRCRVLQPEDSARALCSLPAGGPLVLALPEPLGGGSQAELVSAALAGLALPPASPGGQPAAKEAALPAPAALVAAASAAPRAAVAAAAAAGVQADARGWQQAVASLAAVLEAAALKARSGGGGEGHPAAAADVAVPAEAAAVVAWQEACGDGVRQFSQACCKRAAATAAEAYRRNTPALLPAAGHAVALQAALRLYSGLAAGPAAAAGAAALRQQLDAYWLDGRRQCDAVSFLGNPCCLPAHDPLQQPHTSAPGGGARPVLLLASGSGAQQHSIPEPFTVAELQRAAAAVAVESAKAAARAQFYVRRRQAEEGAGPAAAAAGGPAAGGAAAAAGGASAAAGGAAGEQGALEEEEAGRRDRLSGDGHSSGEEEEGEEGAGPAGSGAAASGGDSAAVAAAAALGLPAAGCALELHVLGPRSEWRSAALSAALLQDGQPGWLRAGGVMFAQLAVQVAVPLKPGQRQAKQQAGSVPEEAAEEFPSLADAAQAQRQREQRQRPAAAAKKQQAEGGAALQAPQLLSWPGWQAEAAEAAALSRPALVAPRAAGPGAPSKPAGSRAPLVVAVTRPRMHAGRGRAGRGGSRPHKQPVGAGLAADGPAAAAAAAVAAGAASAEQATLLLGFEYESAQGQRLLLTPALLAAVRASSLDCVSVRQHGAQPAAPGPATAAAAAAATAAASGGPPAAAPFLLLRDAPLWLQLPADQLAALAGKRRPPAPAGGPPAPAAAWLQLRRLLVATPEAAVRLEAAPKLLLEVPRDMLAPPGGGGGASGGGPPAASAPPPATLQLEYSLAAPLPLPPASFCVLALPWLLTAPTALQGGASGAAAPAAAGGAGPGAGPAALIRQSGPLRAVLAGGTAVRPAM